MERIAKKAHEKVQPLCERLAKASGDRVGMVDVVLWYAVLRHYSAYISSVYCTATKLRLVIAASEKLDDHETHRTPVSTG
jgi:hypothetical protein